MNVNFEVFVWMCVDVMCVVVCVVMCDVEEMVKDDIVI